MLMTTIWMNYFSFIGNCFIKGFHNHGNFLMELTQMHVLFCMMNGKTEDIAYFIILIALTAKILQQLFCDLLTNQRSTVV